MELLKAAAASVRIPEYGGDPISFAAPPKVTVVRHSDGATIIDGEEATKVEDGEETYWVLSLTAANLSEVDLLTITWEGELEGDGEATYTTYAEVVGGYIVSLAKVQGKLDATNEKTSAELFEAREVALRDIEAACGVAFRARYGKEAVDGTGHKRLKLRQPQLQQVLSVSIDGEELSAEELEALTVDPAGILIRETDWPEGASNVLVAYVHGFQGFPEAADLVRDLAAHRLSEYPTDWDERATSKHDEQGFTYTLVTAGVRGANFPLPSVNAFIKANRFVSVI